MINTKITESVLERFEQLLDQIIGDSSNNDSFLPFINALKSPFDPYSIPDQRFFHTLIFGTFCIQVPEELIYAVGAQPVRLCMGVDETADLCDDRLPKMACPLIKSITGFMKLETPYFRHIRHFIIPATCDWKVKHLEQMNPDNHTWFMDLPHLRDAEYSRKKWFSEIVRLKEWLERQSGKKIRRNNILSGISFIHAAQREFDTFLSLRRSGWVSGCAAILVANAHFYMHIKDWTHALCRLNQSIQDANSANIWKGKKQQPRILLTGSPVIFPHFKIPILLENAGCLIVADELCSSERIFSDIVSIDDKTETGLLHAIADRYLLPCTCPTFSSNKNRMRRLLECIHKFNIDGIVYHVLKGCHPYDIESFPIEKEFKERKIPFLKLETDYSQEDTGQIKTRIEAFAEMVK